MKTRPLVSVIVPTYQRAGVLEEALRSAVAQTYDRIEVLVEDDGSTDGSEAVVARIGDPRVRYAWEPNAGCPAPARNRGIRKARGELIAFLDSDDVWKSELLARQVEALQRAPELHAVACNAHWLPARDRLLLRIKEDAFPSFDEMLLRSIVMCTGAVVRREALDAVGPFDEDPAVIEDYDLFLRVLRHRDRSIRVLCAPLFHRRVSADAISVHGRRELARIRLSLAKHEDFRPDAVRAALARRERDVRGGELRQELRAGTLPVSEWLRAPEVPLRRRLRLAAKAVLLGRARV
jgi:glycosyltransferase involved in cell wall biosynthesis